MWRNIYNETCLQKRIFTSVIMILQASLVCCSCVSKNLNLDMGKVSDCVIFVSAFTLLQRMCFSGFTNNW